MQLLHNEVVLLPLPNFLDPPNLNTTSSCCFIKACPKTMSGHSLGTIPNVRLSLVGPLNFKVPFTLPSTLTESA